MVLICIAPKCTQRSKRTPRKNTVRSPENPVHSHENTVHFHKFPNPKKSPERFAQWISFCRRNGDELSSKSRICSRHFQESDYDPSQLMRQRLLPNEKFMPQLKSGAVPFGASKNTMSRLYKHQLIPEKSVFIKVEDSRMSVAKDPLELTSSDLTTHTVKVKNEFIPGNKEDEGSCTAKNFLSPELAEYPIREIKTEKVDADEDATLADEYLMEGGNSSHSHKKNDKIANFAESLERDIKTENVDVGIGMLADKCATKDGNCSHCYDNSYHFLNFAESQKRVIKTETISMDSDYGAITNESTTKCSDKSNSFGNLILHKEEDLGEDEVPQILVNNCPEISFETQKLNPTISMTEEPPLVFAASSSADHESKADSRQQATQNKVTCEKPSSFLLCATKFRELSHSAVDSTEKALLNTVCGATSTPSQRLKTDSSDDEKRFVCLDCNKSFRWHYKLKRHSARHFNQEPFSCSVCSATFKSYQELKRHSALHSDAKPFSCSFCTARFKKKWELKIHSVVHSDVKPFSCLHCAARFKTKPGLRKHSCCRV